MKPLLKPMVFTVFALALSLSAYASPNSPHSQDAQDCSTCTQPPVSLTPGSQGFTLQDAISLYQAGAQPTDGELRGNWNNVGVATVPGQPDPSITDGYSTTGLKNSDGSPVYSLSFSDQSSGVDFSGSAIATSLGVTLQNLGSSGTNQGPNLVQGDSDSGAACFAQYLYNEHTGALMKSHLNFACRLLAGQNDKMVCENTIIVDPSENDPSILPQYELDWSGKVVYYYAYVKTQ